MAYDPKPNTGTLFPNDFKKAENHPDVKGDLFIERDLLNALMIKNPNGLIKISISGWNKESANGKSFVSLSASEPWVKPAEDEIPY
jgi:hypothetical protein